MVSILSSLVFKIMLLWFIIFFIFSQIVIEKEWLPSKILDMRLLHICFLTIASILFSVLVGILISQPIFVVGSTTIFLSTLTSWKYRNKYDKVESRKR
ncbi:putative membrane protein [Enterococcus rivorum]|nr:putative membrane protein [Enterococcus rivorum]